MKKYFVLFLCITTLLLALLGCGGGGSHKTNNVDLINTLLDNYQTAYLQTNTENFISLLTFPFTINAGEDEIILNNITEAREMFGFEDLTYQTFSISSRTINVNGDSATVNATINYHVTNAPDSSVEEGTDVVVISCIKVNGAWKMSGETIASESESPNKSINLFRKRR